MLKQLSQESHVGIQPAPLEKELSSFGVVLKVPAIYRRQAAQLHTVKTIYKGNLVLFVQAGVALQKVAP